MSDSGETSGKEFSEWILDLKSLFDPGSVSKKISDYIEENPVPEQFHNAAVLFYYDFNIENSMFMVNKLVRVDELDASSLDKLRKNENFTLSDFKDIMNLSMLDNPEGFEIDFHKWNKGLEDSFGPDKLSEKIYDYVKKHPLPENSNLDGMSFNYDLNTKKSALVFSGLTSKEPMKPKSSDKKQKGKGITLPGFKKSLYSLMDEYDLNATLIFADDIKELQSLYFRSVVGNENFSDIYSSSDLKITLEKDSSKFDKDYTGFRLYNNINDFFVVYKKSGSEAVLVNTSLKNSELSAEEILSYF
ncbi:MAG: hypothetical protein KAS90_00130 [Candidatus Aenigmarchaeota archaeon]|nr:hypothetical protein [Candidatus Aenigmarchaeota archaeon]